VRADAVEQLFVERRGGRVAILVVLESPAGERQRERMLAPTSDAAAAVRYAAVQLSRRGMRVGERLRVRRERGGTLVDDPALQRAFLDAMEVPDEEEPWG